MAFSDVTRRVSMLGTGPLLLGLALAMGAAFRLAAVAADDFPLLDGGLFSTMAHDLRNAGFALPLHSSYNTGEVPFAYPPLGIYLLAVVPGDPIATERWLPLVYSLLAIVAAYLLARELTGERTGGFAALVFAAMPITWTLEGAGVTRGLGLALLLGALWRIAVLLQRPTAWNVVLAGGVAGLALLSHPGIGPAGVASAAILFASRPRSDRAAALAGAGLVAAAVASPWIITLTVRYGWDALATASGVPHGRAEEIVRLLTVGPSWIEPFDFVVPLALLGTVVLLHRRQWLLPVWALLLVLVPGANGRNAAVVWAMLAASGAVILVEDLARRGALRLAAGVAFAWLLIAPVMSGYPRYEALPEGVRDAMARAGQATPPGTRFAVLGGDGGVRGLALEWFPTLAGRVSPGTHMGLEWTSPRRFREAREQDAAFLAGNLDGADAVFTITGDTATWTMLR